MVVIPGITDSESIVTSGCRRLIVELTTHLLAGHMHLMTDPTSLVNGDWFVASGMPGCVHGVDGNYNKTGGEYARRLPASPVFGNDDHDGGTARTRRSLITGGRHC